MLSELWSKQNEQKRNAVTLCPQRYVDKPVIRFLPEIQSDNGNSHWLKRIHRTHQNSMLTLISKLHKKYGERKNTNDSSFSHYS